MLSPRSSAKGERRTGGAVRYVSAICHAGHMETNDIARITQEVRARTSARAVAPSYARPDQADHESGATTAGRNAMSGPPYVGAVQGGSRLNRAPGDRESFAASVARVGCRNRLLELYRGDDPRPVSAVNCAP